MKKSERDINIDIIRTIAIFLVIIFHLLYAIEKNEFLRKLGFVGISLFFILSGYLLAKKYSEEDKFSIKWFFRRYLKIASFYYIALVVLVILFSKQIYQGNILKNLLLHFVFLDFISKETIYGIISPAWFLIPLMGLYLLFPFINKFAKKWNWFIIPIILVSFCFRLMEGVLVPFNPLYFIAEFGFGIVYAHTENSRQKIKQLPKFPVCSFPILCKKIFGIVHKKNNLFLLLPLIFYIMNPVMAIPFIIFFILVSLPLNFISSFPFSWIGANTMPLFLYHESFIETGMGKLSIYGLNRVYSFSILIVVVLISVQISNRIVRSFCKINKI